MTYENIPDVVRRFVSTSIPSVPFLEALLLMQAVPEAEWDAGALARRLYLPEHIGATVLRDLAEAGFIVEKTPGSYHYFPQSDSVNELIIAVREVYARNLVGVTNLIHAKAHEKVQQFADAFKLRKQ